MTARRPVVIKDNRLIELPDGDTVVGADGGDGDGGGTEFLSITNTDLSDATYYYYGGTDSAADWKINRYLKSDLNDVTSADEVGNGSYGSLGAAWTDRATLIYA